MPNIRVHKNNPQVEEAFVLDKQPAGEDSLYVRLLGKNRGKFVSIAGKARKSIKRFINGLEPFELVKIQYKKIKNSSNLFFLEQSKPIRFFERLTCFPKACFMGFLANELILKSLMDEEGANNVFGLYYDMLLALNAEPLKTKPMFMFMHELFKVIGIAPSLMECVKCGYIVSKEPFTLLSIEDGGAVCVKCRLNEESRYSLKLNQPISSILDDEIQLEKLVQFYVDFWQYRFNRPLHAWKGWISIKNEFGALL